MNGVNDTRITRQSRPQPQRFRPYANSKPGERLSPEIQADVRYITGVIMWQLYSGHKKAELPQPFLYPNRSKMFVAEMMKTMGFWVDYRADKASIPDHERRWYVIASQPISARIPRPPLPPQPAFLENNADDSRSNYSA